MVNRQQQYMILLIETQQVGSKGWAVLQVKACPGVLGDAPLCLGFPVWVSAQVQKRHASVAWSATT